MNKIKLQNKIVSYTLRKSKRARRMRLAVYCNGTVVVTTPYDLRESLVEKFIIEKASWLFSKLNFFKQYKGHTITRYSHDDYLKYKDSAYYLASKLVEKFNKEDGLRYNKINIKNQKTRWGSCSKKGNLNFNYKIALLPEKLADYIIVHELCHLKEFNHSQKFWALVAKAIPNYQRLKDELKQSGLYFD